MLWMDTFKCTITTMSKWAILRLTYQTPITAILKDYLFFYCRYVSRELSWLLSMPGISHVTVPYAAMIKAVLPRMK